MLKHTCGESWLYCWSWNTRVKWVSRMMTRAVASNYCKWVFYQLSHQFIKQPDKKNFCLCQGVIEWINVKKNSNNLKWFRNHSFNYSTDRIWLFNSVSCPNCSFCDGFELNPQVGKLFLHNSNHGKIWTECKHLIWVFQYAQTSISFSLLNQI